MEERKGGAGMLKASTGIQKVHFHTDWMDVPVMMDPAAVAVVLGRSYESVRKAIQTGRLPAVKVLGGWLVRKDQLMAHLGYADWEIERYGYGMATPRQGRGYNPVIQDDFSTALHRKGAAG